MKCEYEIIHNETKMKYQSWKWRELKKKKMEWNIIWKQKTEMNEMISIDCSLLNELKWLLFVIHIENFIVFIMKLRCFQKEWKKNKEEWIDIPLIHNTILMSFCVITQQISTFSFLFFPIKNIPQNSPITSGSEDVSFFFFGFFFWEKNEIL